MFILICPTPTFDRLGLSSIRTISMAKPASGCQDDLPQAPRDVITKSLDISDLAAVLAVLRRNKLPCTEYNTLVLGLQFGLYSATLHHIKSRGGKARYKRDDPDQYDMEVCVKAWLEGQDGVIKTGLPSWYVLVEAVAAGIDETIAANIKAEFRQHSFPIRAGVQTFMSETRTQLEEKNRYMKQLYANTVYDIFNSSHMRHQYNSVDEATRAIKDYLSQISETILQKIDGMKLQNIVLKHSSWFNYDLLQFLADKCEGSKLFKCYLHNILHDYRMLPVIEIPPTSYDFRGSSETHKREVCFEVPDKHSSITGLDLRHITTTLKEKLELPSLILRRHEEQCSKCIELYFGIPDKADLQAPSSFSSYTKWDEENEMYYVTSDILSIEDNKLLVPRRTLNILQVTKHCNQEGYINNDKSMYTQCIYNYSGVIGHGIFGTSYRAEDLSSGDQVVIKLLAIESLHKTVNITLLPQVLLQAKALLKLRHCHVVAYSDAFDYTVPNHSKGVAVVFEYCSKGDLPFYLSYDKHQNISVHYKWYTQLASACCFIHDQNLLHYDLEPSNILVDANDELKICDVGMAKIAWDMWATHNSQDMAAFLRYMTSAAGSTKYYMAPEVSSGHYSSKSDVFSLGLVYIKIAESQSITGPPVPIGKDKPLGIALSKRIKNPCSVIACEFKRAENAEIQLCNKMLQYDPNNRPCMSEVQQEVETMSSNASKLANFTEQFNTSVDSVIDIFQQDAFVHGANVFYQAANAFHIHQENLNRINRSLLPELSQAIDDAYDAICQVSDTLSLLRVQLIPGGGGAAMDQVIQSCKPELAEVACQTRPDFETMSMLFDASKLDARFQELETNCKKAEDLSTSAADMCEKVTRSKIWERAKTLLFLLSLVTLVPLVCMWLVFEPLLQALTSIGILQSTVTLIITMTALVVGTLLTYIYYLGNMDYERATRTLKECAKGIRSLTDSLPELHNAVLDKYNDIEQAKSSIKSLHQYSDEYGHYTSDAVFQPLSRLKYEHEKTLLL